MKPRAKTQVVSYRSLEEDPSCEHVADRRVRLRVKRPDLDRAMVRTTSAIVKALGKRRRLWFRYERVWDELRARREAAYFDVGVELGTTAVSMKDLRSRRRAVQELGWKLAREALASGASREDAVGAAVVAAWAMLSGAESRQAKRSPR